MYFIVVICCFLDRKIVLSLIFGAKIQKKLEKNTLYSKK